MRILNKNIYIITIINVLNYWQFTLILKISESVINRKTNNDKRGRNKSRARKTLGFYN